MAHQTAAASIAAFLLLFAANPALAKGVNIWSGKVVHPGVAESIGEPAAPLASVLG